MADNMPPPGNDVHEDMRALPKTDVTSTLNERAALAAHLHFKEEHHALHETLRDQIDDILESIRPQLDKLAISDNEAAHFVLREEELRAIVARSINAGAMQTAHTIGHALRSDP